VPDREAPDRAAAVVAVEVAPDRRTHGLATVDVAARHAAAGAVRVLGDRRDVAAPCEELCRRVEDVASLETVPAEVERRLAAVFDVVDLLPCALADVGDVEIAVRTVEGEPPRIAQ